MPDTPPNPTPNQAFFRRTPKKKLTDKVKIEKKEKKKIEKQINNLEKALKRVNKKGFVSVKDEPLKNTIQDDLKLLKKSLKNVNARLSRAENKLSDHLANKLKFSDERRKSVFRKGRPTFKTKNKSK